jgi:hypothetical protein
MMCAQIFNSKHPFFFFSRHGASRNWFDAMSRARRCLLVRPQEACPPDHLSHDNRVNTEGVLGLKQLFRLQDLLMVGH